MRLAPEIKDFVRKVLILSAVFSLFVSVLVAYLGSLIATPTASATETTNDTNFVKKNVDFIGVSGVALSYNVGTAKVMRDATPVNLADDTVEISAVLSDKGTARDKLLSAHMANISSYMNLLKTDVPALLDQSSDRQTMLETFVDDLAYRQTRTDATIATLAAQGRELQSTITQSNQKIDAAKTTLDAAYKNFDYDRTQSTVDAYLQAKQDNTYATTYLVFIGKFLDSYRTLSAYGKQLQDTINANREPLIKNVTVTLPDSGTTLMKKLQLLQTQAESKLKQ